MASASDQSDSDSSLSSARSDDDLADDQPRAPTNWPSARPNKPHNQDTEDENDEVDGDDENELDQDEDMDDEEDEDQYPDAIGVASPSRTIEQSSDIEPDDDDADSKRPSKRRKLGGKSIAAYQSSTPPGGQQRRGTHDNVTVSGTAMAGASAMDGPLPSEDVDISSDSTGSVPGSPSSRRFPPDASFQNALPTDEFSLSSELPTQCEWIGCDAGDLANHDALLRHVLDVHVNGAVSSATNGAESVSGKKAAGKYTCEWASCKARSKTQLSAYALKGHMRSHTKEKPYFCGVPECDKSFTRTDALMKHMRTVHEPEMVKAAEQELELAKEKEAAGKKKRSNGVSSGDGAFGASKAPKTLKLTFGKTSSAPATPVMKAEDITSDSPPLSPRSLAEVLGPMPPECDFLPEELSMSRRDLFRLLRRQVNWAEQDGKDLQRECERLEKERRDEWMKKELVLENVMEAELGRAKRRGVLDTDDLEDEKDGLMNGDSKEVAAKQVKDGLVAKMQNEIRTSSKLPLNGSSHDIWYRDPAKLRVERAPKASKRKAITNDGDAIMESSEKRSPGLPGEDDTEADD